MSIKQLAREGNSYVAIVVVFFCILFFKDIFDLFAYQRQEILSGEYWRMITGHLTHFATIHWLINLFAWILIWLYGRSVCSALVWVCTLLVCSVGVSSGILIFLPDLQTYTGLSGILHGFLIVIAVLHIHHSRYAMTGWIILLFITGKLVYEAFYGPTPTTAELIEMRVITEAHLYGAFSGVLVIAGLFLTHYLRTTKKPSLLKTRL